jgi:creatinine amidohydrolase/Fe(II)-dependent formamide hydrolase-like protein
MGASPIEIYTYPKGVVGKATLAKAEKAYQVLKQFSTTRWNCTTTS